MFHLNFTCIILIYTNPLHLGMLLTLCSVILASYKSVCMYMCVRACSCVCRGLYMQVREQLWVSYLRNAVNLICQTRSALKLPWRLGRLPPPLQHWNYNHTSLCDSLHGLQGPNSGLCANTASTLLSHLSPFCELFLILCT